jgi:hypothetical protein
MTSGKYLLGLMTASGLAALTACSPVMESQRPDPVDLSQFKPGEQRFDVVKVVGTPMTSMKHDGQSCDIYQLYTHGPTAGGKAAIAFTEAVADVFTLGLAEAVSTPTEAATKNSKYPVTFCYDDSGKLISVEETPKPTS